MIFESVMTMSKIKYSSSVHLGFLGAPSLLPAGLMLANQAGVAQDCPMVGKRVQFDDETWEAIQALARATGKSFQELTSTAFTDLLNKHDQPVGFKAALEASVTSRSKVKRSKQK